MDMNDALKNIETVFVIDGFYLEPNGVMQSVMNKTRLMENEWGYRPIIFVTRYATDIKSIQGFMETEFSDRPAQLNPGTRVIGMFEYLCGMYPYKTDIAAVEYPRCDPDEGLEYEEPEPDIYMGYKDGKHVRTEIFSAPGGRLRYIVFFDGDGKREKTFEFDDIGQLSRLTVWDKDIESYHPAEYYFSPDKKIRIIAQYRWEADANRVDDPVSRGRGDQNVLLRYLLHDKNENPVQEFNLHTSLVAYCLDELSLAKGKKVLLMDETGVYSDGVAYTKSLNVIKAHVMHGNFLSEPGNINSPPSVYLKGVCANRDRFDGIIFLTKGLKNDFIKKYGFSKNYFVMGHPYPFEVKARPFGERDGKKAVMVTRFDAGKRVELAVEIFKRVCDELDDVTLDIYGFGHGITNTEGNINQQIKNLGLSERVTLKGYTNNAAEVFSNAAVSLMTSAHEAYPLTLIESVCGGCPAFAFNVKHGPPEIIKDGITGCLIQDNDEAAYARKLISFFNDEEARRNMTDNCYKDAASFGKEVFLNNWLSFMNTVANRS
ncbi:MAG: glycosyltransferase [Clostridiales bacterium]|jgi:poly(glycerol-phosphate) alpha-glucosyltransferase|nr:glycosyltransferase [Clostridiales bacterium]